MYSLLNYIAAASKEITDGSTSTHLASIAQYMSTSEHGSTLHSMEAGLRGMSEEEKRLVGISTIAVVTRLALEFKVEEVTRLTISMLLQRLRLAEPSVEAAISNNLVDLALAAPESSFIDIIRAFSAINRFANPDDPRFSNNMVLAAQTRLAKEIHRRPEFAMIYLTELLTLFGDRGVAIQNIAASNQQVKTDDMVEQLASLLLPIDALLNHETFDAATIAGFSSEVVALFRNMWFLCTLFQFTAAEGDGSGSAMQWQKPALLHIAVKSPAIVSEEARESLSGDIEYNSVIRQEYALNVRILRLSKDNVTDCIITGHREAPDSVEQAHCSAGTRDSDTLAGTDRIPAHDARNGEHAVKHWQAIVAGDILPQRESKPERSTQCLYGIHR
jgi:phosphatidylinositol 4-kinase